MHIFPCRDISAGARFLKWLFKFTKSLAVVINLFERAMSSPGKRIGSSHTSFADVMPMSSFHAARRRKTTREVNCKRGT